MARDVTVGDLLKAARGQRGVSLRQAAGHIGVDPSYLSRVEAGIQAPSHGLRQAASEYYGLASDELLLASGVVPSDVVDILRRNPRLLGEIRRRGRLS
jgi:transcriptional regulator with XRE-family HTH domain